VKLAVVLLVILALTLILGAVEELSPRPRAGDQRVRVCHFLGDRGYQLSAPMPAAEARQYLGERQFRTGGDFLYDPARVNPDCTLIPVATPAATWIINGTGV